jgi:hypothetical protein
VGLRLLLLVLGLFLFGVMVVDVTVGLLRRMGEGPKATWERELELGLPGELSYLEVAVVDMDGDCGGGEIL